MKVCLCVCVHVLVCVYLCVCVCVCVCVGLGLSLGDGPLSVGESVCHKISLEATVEGMRVLHISIMIW